MARFATCFPGWILLAFLAPTASFGQTPALDGAPFVVNTYTTDLQRLAAVATDPADGFVVVWQSVLSPGNDTLLSVQGQRYASDGSPVASQFQVNTYTTDSQLAPAVAVGPAGDFVVVWDSYGSYGSDSSSYSIQGRRYASDGSPQGGELQVNTYTTGLQFAPSVASGPDGGFVVVWTSYGSVGDDSFGSIQAQRFASDGSPLSGQFQVNTYTTSRQNQPSVASDGTGRFVVVWTSWAAADDPSYLSVQGQLYASDGSPLSGQFQVNTYTTDDQGSPSVAMAPGGDFVVVWDSGGSDGGDVSDTSIQGQRFASDGSPVAGEFQVNTYTDDTQSFPSVAVSPEGDVIVTWMSLSPDLEMSGYGIAGRLYDSNGDPAGGEFLVNSYTPTDQRYPSVAADTAGNLVVVWQSNTEGAPGSGLDIHGQRLSLPIFYDGFESGDTTAWSSVMP